MFPLREVPILAASPFYDASMNTPFSLLRVAISAEAPPEAPVTWVALDEGGAVRARGQSPLRALPDAQSLELVIPAGRVAPHRLELPANAGRHEPALIRQALEDRVLGALDRCLIVAGERDGKRLTAWVADRDWIVRVAEALGDRLGRLTPEQALLAPGELAEGLGGWLFRTQALDYGVLPSRELALQLGGPDLTQIPELLAASADPQRVNLLAGLPRLRRSGSAIAPRQLIPVAGLLLAAALLYLLSQCLVWRQLSAQESALRQAIRQNFAAARPGVPIVDPILQWRQANASPTREGQDALDALAGFAAQTGLTLHPRRIESDDKRLRLTLTVAEANQLKPVLQQKNIVFESGSTDNGLVQLTINDKPGGKS